MRAAVIFVLGISHKDSKVDDAVLGFANDAQRSPHYSSLKLGQCPSKTQGQWMRWILSTLCTRSGSASLTEDGLIEEAAPGDASCVLRIGDDTDDSYRVLLDFCRRHVVYLLRQAANPYRLHAPPLKRVGRVHL